MLLLRGYGSVHPTVGELRVGNLGIYVADPMNPQDEEESYYIGDIRVSEVESLIPHTITNQNGESQLEFQLAMELHWDKMNPRQLR